MCVENFEEAIEVQNSSEFGLTGGLHSLDPTEIAQWRERVEVGNAYINRTTTGAIVRRQPFGGWKDSCVGPGPKAGGPNYVSTFLDWTEERLPTVASSGPWLKPDLFYVGSSRCWVSRTCHRLGCGSGKLRLLVGSNEFSIEHDPSQVHGETNHFRYRPRPWHLLAVLRGLGWGV